MANTHDGNGADGPADDGEPFDAVAAAAELGDLASASAEGAAADSSYVRDLETEVESLSAMVAQKDAQIKKIEDRLDDALEDVERSKQRVEREADKVLEQKSKKLLLGFIDVLDDLERAIEAARSTDHNPAVVEGVEMVRRTFLSRLGQFGVSHRPSMGETFDPNVHDAVSMVAVSDAAQHNKVVGVAQEGYLLGDVVLRPARVAVGKHG